MPTIPSPARAGEIALRADPDARPTAQMLADADATIARVDALLARRAAAEAEGAAAPADVDPTGPSEADDAWLAERNGVWHASSAPPLPGLPLAEYVRMQAAWFRSMGTEAADLIAENLDELAGEVEFTRAHTPEEFRDRRALLLEWAAEDRGVLPC